LQAQSNISFLSLLKEPCEELAQLKPREIVPKLAHILNIIRVIWVNSSYYNTHDKITALLSKVRHFTVNLIHSGTLLLCVCSEIHRLILPWLHFESCLKMELISKTCVTLIAHVILLKYSILLFNM